MTRVRAARCLIAAVALAAVACGGGSGSAATGSPATTPASASPPSPVALPSGFQVYRSDSPAFSIAHPGEWTTRTGVSGSLVAFVSPQSGDAFVENVNVLRQDLPSGTTLQEYTDVSLSQAGSVFGDFNTLSSTTTSLSGLPAQRVEYTGTYQGHQLHWLSEWLVDGGNAWVVTFSSDPHDYDTVVPDGEATISSLRLG